MTVRAAVKIARTTLHLLRADPARDHKATPQEVEALAHLQSEVSRNYSPSIKRAMEQSINILSLLS